MAAAQPTMAAAPPTMAAAQPTMAAPANPGAVMKSSDWEKIEGGAVNEHSQEVSKTLDEAALNVVQGREQAAAKQASRLKTLKPEHYELLRAGGKQKTPPAKKKGKAEILRETNALKKLMHFSEKIGDLRQALKRTAPSGFATLTRTHQDLLRSEVAEVRCLTLGAFAQASAACRPSSDESEACGLELDAAIQKFLGGLSCGDAYENPRTSRPPAPQALSDLQEALAGLRKGGEFRGEKLARLCPRAVYYTIYDSCLPRSPVAARPAQVETLQALDRLLRGAQPFLLMNASPPGSGKSSLLAPVAKHFASESFGVHALYVSAGQGATGTVQFMRALYAASLPFAYVCREKTGLRLAQQHRDRTRAAAIYVGTPDAIEALVVAQYGPAGHARGRPSFLVMDEPNYGSDGGPDNPACRANMRLLACLPPPAQHVLWLGATLPPLQALPGISAWAGVVAKVSADADSLPLPCALIAEETGEQVLPWGGCRTPEDLRLAAQNIASRPFTARTVRATDLVKLADRLPADNRALTPKFDSIQTLRPARVQEAAQRLLEEIAASPNVDIAKVCAPSASGLPPELSQLAAKAADGKATLVVDLDPATVALQIGGGVLACLGRESISASSLYEALDAKLAKLRAAQERSERRHGKPAKRNADAEDKTFEPPDAEELAPSLDFPSHCQIGTASHLQAHGGCARHARPPVEPALVPQLPGIADEYQLLLLAGLGVITGQGALARANAYQAEVLRRGAQGQLALLAGDHSACYGANLVLSRVRLTSRFCEAASLQTVIQAGGRLGRVGLTYEGELVVPSVTARALVAGCADEGREAATMEKAFAQARAEAPRRCLRLQEIPLFAHSQKRLPLLREEAA